jgi:membrane-bound lytic murein transglycosylase B
MRIAYRLLLLGSVAACAPMVPAPPQPQPVPPPVIQPAPATPPAPVPAQPDLAEAYDHASFDAWKQGFLARHGGARKWEYARELESVTPGPQPA